MNFKKYTAPVFICTLLFLNKAYATTTTDGFSDSVKVDKSAYLFASFRGNGEDGLHLSWSNDGYHWNVIQNDKSFFLLRSESKRSCETPAFFRGWTGCFIWCGQLPGADKPLDMLFPKTLSIGANR